MKKNIVNKHSHITYTEEPMRLGKRVVDFLPSPKEIALKEDTVKVTIALSRRSIKFFKQQALKHSIKYQKLIRLLLDEYTGKNQQAAS